MEVRQGLRAPGTSPGAVGPSGEGEPLRVDAETIEELDEIFARKRARDAKTSGTFPEPRHENRTRALEAHGGPEPLGVRGPLS